MVIVESVVMMLKAFFHICVTVLAVIFVMFGGNTDKVMDMRVYKCFYEEELEPETSELVIDDVSYNVTLEGTRLYNIFHIDPWGSSPYRPQTTRVTIEYPEGFLYEGEVQKFSLYVSDILNLQPIDDETVEMTFKDHANEERSITLVRSD